MTPARTTATNVMVAPPPKTGAVALKSLVSQPAIEKRIAEVLGKRAPQFTASMISLASDPMFRDVEPGSIISECMKAAVLDLPIEKSLGFAHIVPYAGKASFQIGYKGLIQLAQRTGSYAKMNARVVNAEAFNGYDEVGDPIIEWDKLDDTKEPVGYVFAFKTVFGFSKLVYWPIARVLAHAEKYSQAYRYGKANPSKANSPWFNQFDSMALKTAIKDGLSHWGPLSVEQTFQQALQTDTEGESIEVEATVERPVMPLSGTAGALTDAPPVKRKPGRPSRAEMDARAEELQRNAALRLEREKAAAVAAEPPDDVPMDPDSTPSSNTATAAGDTEPSVPSSSPVASSSAPAADSYDPATWLPDFSSDDEIRESVAIWMEGENLTEAKVIEFMKSCGQSNGTEQSIADFDAAKLKKLLMARKTAVEAIRK